jgi:MFS transporter, DHA2 family, glioxin efflux transporter
VGSAAIGKIGYFQPFLIVGSMLAAIGAGLIYTFDLDTPPSKFIGYQVVAGTGIGLAIQIPIIVAQATSSAADVSVAMSSMLCKWSESIYMLDRQLLCIKAY